MESPILPEECVVSRATLADMQELLNKLTLAVAIMDAAMVEVSNWPDGGNRYGQGKIKMFVTDKLNEARRARYN